MSNLSVNTITNAAGANTAQINGMTPTADSLQGFRNRVINGSMVIDQRNAGASVTVNLLAQIFAVDRWYGFGQATDGVFTLQQDAQAPAGFVNSLKATVTTADASIGASQIYGLVHRIEGFNCSDLGWGTANAQSVTLSFWVRSSVTGAFGAAVKNGPSDRSYPFGYTINAANTWEQKAITIPGDTTGTWLTNNGIGLSLLFSIGTGATALGTAGVWAASNFNAPTGSVNLIATSGATFYITGVQLEAGSVATPFERRPYGTELQLAMRYFIRINDPGGIGVYGGGVVSRVTFPLPVPMRSSITLTAPSTYNFYNGATIATGTVNSYFPGATNQTPQVDFTVAGYATGAAIALYTNGGSQFITASAEL